MLFSSFQMLSYQSNMMWRLEACYSVNKNVRFNYAAIVSEVRAFVLGFLKNSVKDKMLYK